MVYLRNGVGRKREEKNRSDGYVIHSPWHVSNATIFTKSKN